MKKIILSSLMVLSLAGATLGATSAFFSDVETSTGNTFTAGAVDLLVDNSAWYNGVFQEGMSWSQTNLTIQKFFNLLDVKPGDWEEDTISLHVNDNPSWMCMNINLTTDDDKSSTNPELLAGDVQENPLDFTDGELASRINSIWWADDGDNVLETDEYPVKVLAQGTLEQLASTSIKLADATGNVWNPQGGPVPGATTMYVGKAFCFGALTPNPVTAGQGVNPGVATGFICDGTLLDNITQSDTLTADLSFFAVQSRNNGKFTCAPGNIGCLGVADVMLVLDRSGSIDAGTELPVLQSAANAFVTALNPQAAGVHIGLASFSTTATLDEHLTDNIAAVQADINALFPSGLTALGDGLLTAQTELANPGDGDDRPDGGSPDFIIVITDGDPNVPGPDAAAARAFASSTAASIQAGGTQIYVVGVGVSSSTSLFLQDEIASTPGHYFDAGDFTNLSAILTGIANCEERNPIP